MVIRVTTRTSLGWPIFVKSLTQTIPKRHPRLVADLGRGAGDVGERMLDVALARRPENRLQRVMVQGRGRVDQVEKRVTGAACDGPPDSGRGALERADIGIDHVVHVGEVAA